MKFTKEKIIDFKLKGRSYITFENSIKLGRMKDYFYRDAHMLLKDTFPNANIEYCHCDMYSIVIGDFQTGIKYVTDDSTYYMFISASSFWADPLNIAIGKAVNGKIYLIREAFPWQCSLTVRVIPEEYINKNELGFRPKSYEHTIYPEIKEINDEDVEYIKIAYEGVKAFDNLIKSVS